MIQNTEKPARLGWTLSLGVILLVLSASGAWAQKTVICHFPPGNPDNFRTISVNQNALDAHLAHGDLLGSCLENCEAICDDGDACTQDFDPDASKCVCMAEPIDGGDCGTGDDDDDEGDDDDDEGDDDDDDGEEPDCDDCDGQVNELTLLYHGDEEVFVLVTQKLAGQEVAVFEDFVQPEEPFTISGVNRHGTFGSKILLYADERWQGRIHTSCSEPIGPGLVLKDFEVVGGESRHGGTLCPLETGEGDGEDDEEGCAECAGQVTELTLRYDGDAAAHVEVTQKIRGRDVTLFDALVQPGEPLTINGQRPNGALGSNVKVFVEGALSVRIHTSCSEPIGAGLVAGDFVVLDGASRNGGRLCPLPAGN